MNELSGHLLLAMPGIGDSRFENTVIAMCEHSEDGALGIDIGHVHTGIRLHDIYDQVEIDPGAAPDCDVYIGGPVETGRGFFLHTPDWQGDGTIAVGDWGALSTSQAILHAIAEGQGPRRWLIALGYAGWGPHQLDGEMQRNGWYPAKANETLVFDTPAAERWTACWRAEGIDPSLLSASGGTA
ncbi:MAG: YqgE/AlgH family protein [Caenibius sp.]